MLTLSVVFQLSHTPHRNALGELSQPNGPLGALALPLRSGLMRLR